MARDPSAASAHRPQIWIGHLSPTAAGDLNWGSLRRIAPFLLAGLLSAVVHSAHAQLPHPQLKVVFPPGAQVETDVEIALEGSDLDDVRQLVFSHPGIKATRKKAGDEPLDPDPRFVPNRFIVRPSADVPPGLYEVRAIGHFGLSNPRVFAVGELSEQTPGQGHQTVETAVKISAGTVVNARAAADQVHYYRIPVPAGQATLVECFAERIDSRMDATFVLMDGRGRELQRVHNTIGRDPVLLIRAKEEDAEYVVGVYDFTYQGGGEYPYRLAVHTRPKLLFADPPVGHAGQKQQLTLFGWNLPGGVLAKKFQVEGAPLERIDVVVDLTKQAMPLPAAPPHAPFMAGVPYRVEGKDGVSAPLFIQVSDNQVVSEAESNNSPAEAQPIPVPCEVAGRLYPEGDQDWVSFAANKGDVFDIDVLAHRIGVSSDLVLKVEKLSYAKDGTTKTSQVATVDDVSISKPVRFNIQSSDPVYRLVVDEQAVYRVGVRDLYDNAAGDPRLSYRLSIRRSQPDFRLVAFAEPPRGTDNKAVPIGSLVMRKGSAAVLTVCAYRTGGFNGPIELTAEDLPEGVTSCPTLMRAGATHVPLVLEAAEDSAHWSGKIRIVGRADMGDRTLERVAASGTMIWGAGNANTEAEARMTDGIGLSVAGCDPAPASIHFDQTTFETCLGGKFEMPLKVTRRGDFKAELDLKPVGLPGELKVTNTKIKGDEGKLAVFASKDNIPPGKYTVHFLSQSKAKLPRNPQAIRHAEARQKLFGELVAAKEAENATTVALRDKLKQASQETSARLAQQDQSLREAQSSVQQANQRLKQSNDALLAARQNFDQRPGEEQLAGSLQSAYDQLKAVIVEVKQAKSQVVELEATVLIARAELSVTEAQHAAAQRQATQTEAVHKRSTELKAEADKKLEEAKKNNAPRDYEFQLISPPVQIHVAAAPMEFSLADDVIYLPRDGRVELPIQIARKFGFDGDVDLALKAPGGVAISAPTVKVAKDQESGMLQVHVHADAALGVHTCQLEATAKFNGVATRRKLPLTIAVRPAPAPKS